LHLGRHGRYRRDILVMVKRCYYVSISIKGFFECIEERNVVLIREYVDITRIQSDQEVNTIQNRGENSNLQVNTRTNLRTKF
jgi:hypothetical protein